MIFLFTFFKEKSVKKIEQQKCQRMQKFQIVLKT